MCRNYTTSLKQSQGRNHKGNFKDLDEWNKTYQNLWDAVKAVFRGKFIAVKAYIKKEERSQMDKLIVHFKELTYEEETKHKAEGRK